MSGCPVADRFSPRCPRESQRKCLKATGSTVDSGRCLIWKKAWRSLVGTVRQREKRGSEGLTGGGQGERHTN
jgi:hypothetical protein